MFNLYKKYLFFIFSIFILAISAPWDLLLSFNNNPLNDHPLLLPVYLLTPLAIGIVIATEPRAISKVTRRLQILFNILLVAGGLLALLFFNVEVLIIGTLLQLPISGHPLLLLAAIGQLLTTRSIIRG